MADLETPSDRMRQDWQGDSESLDRIREKWERLAEKMNSDVNLQKQVLAYVWSNPETKELFLAKLEEAGQSTHPDMRRFPGICTGVPLISMKRDPAASLPAGQLTLVSVDVDWSRILKEIAPILLCVFPGVLIATLTQVLLGSRSGLILLPIILLNVL